MEFAYYNFWYFNDHSKVRLGLSLSPLSLTHKVYYYLISSLVLDN